MSPTVTKFACGYTRFPRVSGDEPCALWATFAESSFSPRERG